jgi:8-oxo-dGTP diphosphatase
MRTIINGLIVREGSVLLAKRSVRRTSYAGQWSFPGGHVEQNETLTEALTRELREEIGIIPTEFTHLGLIKDPNVPASASINYHMYRVTRWDGGEPSLLCDEQSELTWKTFDSAATMLDLALDEYRNLFLMLKELNIRP